MRKIAFLFAAAALLFSCSKTDKVAHNCFFEGKDAYDRELRIQDEPQRIVSLSPAATEIAFLLHAEDKLVGVSDYCTYPPEALQLPKVGKLLNINTESILRLNPDLVIIGSIVSKKDVEKMENAGITVFSIKAEEHIDDLLSSISTLGTLLNRTRQADSLKQSYSTQLSNMQPPKKDTKPKVYYVVGFGDGGDYTAPQNSFIHDIITLAGGSNVGETLSTWNISREYLFQEDPDFIFIREEDCQRFCQTEPYSQLSAVRNQHVFPIPSGWMDILSPRNLLAIQYINQKIQ